MTRVVSHARPCIIGTRVSIPHLRAGLGICVTGITSIELMKRHTLTC